MDDKRNSKRDLILQNCTGSSRGRSQRQRQNVSDDFSASSEWHTIQSLSWSWITTHHREIGYILQKEGIEREEREIGCRMPHEWSQDETDGVMNQFPRSWECRVRHMCVSSDPPPSGTLCILVRFPGIYVKHEEGRRSRKLLNEKEERTFVLNDTTLTSSEIINYKSGCHVCTSKNSKRATLSHTCDHRTEWFFITFLYHCYRRCLVLLLPSFMREKGVKLFSITLWNRREISRRVAVKTVTKSSHVVTQIPLWDCGTVLQWTEQKELIKIASICHQEATLIITSSWSQAERKGEWESKSELSVMVSLLYPHTVIHMMSCTCKCTYLHCHVLL